MLDIVNFVERNFDIISMYGNPVTDYRVNCISCGDTKQHLHVSLNKHVVHCFRCGYSKSWVGFAMDVLGVGYMQALGELYSKPKLRPDIKALFQDIPVYTKEVKSNLPSDFKELWNIDKDTRLSLSAKRYLGRRGFGEEYWKRYNLGMSEEVGYRVVIPIEHGYWQGRAISGIIAPKYINPKAENRSLLFNSVALQLYDEIVVCEGAFSAMAVGDNAIAMISKEPTRERIKRMIESPVERFIIALEPGAFPSLEKLADGLTCNGKKVVIWRYDSGDPAEPGSVYQEMDYSFKSKVRLMMENKYKH